MTCKQYEERHKIRNLFNKKNKGDLSELAKTFTVGRRRGYR